jgi:hypothetical protein
MSVSASVTHGQRAVTLTFPPPRAFGDLAEIAADAARMRPPLYVQSIFGPVGSWGQARREYSEFNILSPSHPWRTFRYLRDASIPARPWAPPSWVDRWMPAQVTDLFWRPSRFFREPDRFGSTDSYPEEHWFFINGVATNEDVARLNARLLVSLFHRPVTVMQNATDSLPVDLWECAVGKGFKKNPDGRDRMSMTEPAWMALTAIMEALNDPGLKRVILMAHSQGTIIVSNVLRAVARTLREQALLSTRPRRRRWHDYTRELMGGSPDTRDKALRDDVAHCLCEFAEGTPAAVLERLRKLEVYTFANCADSMKHIVRRGGRAYPYMEHFANENDLVARLGVLSPNDKIEIDGQRFVRRGAWGHLLNEHHLYPIDDYLYPRDAASETTDPYPPLYRSSRATPRLYRYFHGKRPRALAR